VRQVQGGMGLAPLLDPIHLDLAISQIQGSIGKVLGLGNVPSPRWHESNTHTKPKAFGLGSQSSPR